MDTKRIVLYGALFVLSFFLWTTWQKEHPNVPTQQAQTSAASQTSAAGSTTSTTAPKIAPSTVKGSIVTVKTDLLNVQINTAGGTLSGASLLQYPKSLQDKAPVDILNSNADTLYLAQSGVIEQGAEQETLLYQPKKSAYTLGADENEMNVTLVATNKQGISLKKIFTFSRGSYAVGVSYQLKNPTSKSWSGQLYTQIQRKDTAGKKGGGIFSLHTYRGAAISSQQKPYEKISYKKMDAANLSREITGGWVAMQQRYFLTSWIPNQKEQNHYYSTVAAGDVYTIGLSGPAFTLKPGGSNTVDAKFYVGPEISQLLEPLAPGLKLTIDYGWLWFISVAIFWVMQKIFNVIGNWGWSIVLVTLLIKTIFYHLSATSYKSMAKMRQLAPRMKALKERYADDKQKMSQATMALYKEEKINPVGGCLPMLIQIPFFIALYYVLIEAVQLRQAPFIFWIHDLALRDPYYILPIIMGLSMFLQQKISPAPPDPAQAKMMMLMPVIFTVFFMSFPAGLVLYWVVNNVLSILQQWYVMQKMEKAVASAKKKR